MGLWPAHQLHEVCLPVVEMRDSAGRDREEVVLVHVCMRHDLRAEGHGKRRA